MQKLYQSCYVSHNETLKPDKRFCYDFVIGMFFTWPHFLVLQQLTTLYLVPRYLIEVPHQCIYSYFRLAFPARDVKRFLYIFWQEKQLADFFPLRNLFVFIFWSRFTCENYTKSFHSSWVVRYGTYSWRPNPHQSPWMLSRSHVYPWSCAPGSSLPLSLSSLARSNHPMIH